MAKITLKQIAETLGLSIATVSKALKDYDDVSPTTKAKVKALAESLNYKPNFLAQSLRNQESKTIGLVIPEIVHHFFASIISGVINAAKKKGYLVIVLQSSESYEFEKKQIELLLDKNVDGILVSLADNTVNYKHLSNLIESGFPIVLYDKISKSVHCSKVVINDQKAAFNATKYLIDSGCKKIAHVRGPLKPQTTIDRFIGYKNALKEYDMEFDKSIVFEASNLSLENGQDIAKEIYENHKEVDGVFAFTDLTATGVMTGLQKFNVKIPDEISIMGFSNWLITSITSPKLSTIDQPGFEMGKKAFKLLYKEIQNRKAKVEVEFKTIELPTELVIRESTR
ncbi:MAG TPA: LacI family DNA-binding transcriptional regulator [Flavobacteriaceae bacterium]|nr:LacI family DNA-binding transcriptional regulator [Flavobacteriaceae bacterium]